MGELETFMSFQLSGPAVVTEKMRGAMGAPRRDSILMWIQFPGRLRGGRSIEVEAGNEIGTKQVESGWLVDGVKGIPGESCVQSLEGRNHGVCGGNPVCLEHPLWGRPGVRGVAQPGSLDLIVWPVCNSHFME